MKELIYRLASMSRWAKVGVLGVLDLLALPIMLWLSYGHPFCLIPVWAVMPGLTLCAGVGQHLVGGGLGVGGAVPFYCAQF